MLGERLADFPGVRRQPASPLPGRRTGVSPAAVPARRPPLWREHPSTERIPPGRCPAECRSRARKPLSAVRVRPFRALPARVRSPGLSRTRKGPSGGFGVSGTDSSFTASSIPLRTSSDAFLNSAIPLPRLLARSGSRFGPEEDQDHDQDDEHLLEADTEHAHPFRRSDSRNITIPRLAPDFQGRPRVVRSTSGYPIGRSRGSDALPGVS